MVWQIVWKIGWKIGQWERTIGLLYTILKNWMESGMDRIRLSISIIAWNALWVKYNKNRMRSVGQWEQKIGWNLSKHESHQITSVNSDAIKLFKIRKWYAELTQSYLSYIDQKSDAGKVFLLLCFLILFMSNIKDEPNFKLLSLHITYLSSNFYSEKTYRGIHEACRAILFI